MYSSVGEPAVMALAKSVLGYSADFSWARGSKLGAHETFEVFHRPGGSWLLIPANAPARGAGWDAFTGGHARWRWEARGKRWASRLVGGNPWQRVVCLRGDAPPHQTLQQFLEEILDQPVAAVGLRLSTGRPNSKPVVVALGPGARVLAFAKVGTGGLASDLVKREIDILERLRPLPVPVARPEVVFAGPWSGFDLLVTRPLEGRPVGREIPTVIAAAEALSRAMPSQEATLGTSAYWAGIEARAVGVEDLPLVERASSRDLAREVASRWGGEHADFGIGHGDWNRANIRLIHQAVAAHDWERGRFDQPGGVDAAHLLLLEVRRDTRRLGRGGSDLVDQVHRALRPHGYEASRSRMVLALALLELSLRFDEARASGLTVRQNGFAPLLGEIVSSR